MIFLINFLLLLPHLARAQVGIPDPTPTFVTNDYAIVDRRVTQFCLRTCGGECESCCDYQKDPYNPTNYLEICKGRTGAERSVCLELLSNLEFICTRASYKYQTNKPVQEWTAQPVFTSRKRTVSVRPALGITGSSAVPLGIGKKRDAEHYKYDEDLMDANATGVAFQEVFVCANRRGAIHYKPIVPLSDSSAPVPPVKPFWETPYHPRHHHDDDDHGHHRAEDYGFHEDDYGHHGDDYGHHEDDYGHEDDDYGHHWDDHEEDYGHHWDNHEDDYGHEDDDYGHEVDYWDDYGHNEDDYGHHWDDHEDYGHHWDDHEDDYGHHWDDHEDYGHHWDDYGHHEDDYGHHEDDYGHHGDDHGHHGDDYGHHEDDYGHHWDAPRYPVHKEDREDHRGGHGDDEDVDHYSVYGNRGFW